MPGFWRMLSVLLTTSIPGRSVAVNSGFCVQAAMGIYVSNWKVSYLHCHLKKDLVNKGVLLLFYLITIGRLIYEVVYTWHLIESHKH